MRAFKDRVKKETIERENYFDPESLAATYLDQLFYSRLRRRFGSPPSLETLGAKYPVGVACIVSTAVSALSPLERAEGQHC